MCSMGLRRICGRGSNMGGRLTDWWYGWWAWEVSVVVSDGDGGWTGVRARWA